MSIAIRPWKTLFRCIGSNYLYSLDSGICNLYTYTNKNTDGSEVYLSRRGG